MEKQTTNPTESPRLAASSSTTAQTNPRTWCPDSAILAPLARAYDERVRGLEEAATTDKAAQNALKEQCKALALENQKLSEQLHELLDPWNDDQETGSPPTVEQWHELIEQNNKLEEENASLSSSIEALTVETEAWKQKEKSARTEANEVPALREQLKKLANESKQNFEKANEAERIATTLESQMAAMKTTISSATKIKLEMDQVQLRCKELESENQSMLARESPLMVKVAELERSLREVTEKHRSVVRELTMVSADRDRLDAHLSEMQAKIDESEQREGIANRKANESKEIAESMAIERDRALVRAERSESEAKSLNDRLTLEIKQIKDNANEELVHVETKYRAEETRLQSQLDELHAKLAVQTAELGKRERESKSAITELENYRRETLIERQRLQSSLDESTSRVTTLARERDAALASAQRASGELALAVSKAGAADRDSLSLQLADSQQRLLRSEQIARQLKDEKTRLSAHVSELEAEVISLSEARKTAERRLNEEIALVERDCDARCKALQSRIEEAETQRQRALSECRSLSAEHAEVSERWSEEAKTAQLRLQRVAGELQSRVTRLTTRNEELVTRLELANKAQENAEKVAHNVSDGLVRCKEDLRQSEEERVSLAAQLEEAQSQNTINISSTTNKKTRKCQCDILSARLEFAMQQIQKLESGNSKLRDERRRVMSMIRGEPLPTSTRKREREKK